MKLSYRQNYISTFKNFENKTVVIRMEDQLSGDPNTYGVTKSVVDNGDGTITVTFTFSALPADATGTSIGYSADGGANWSSSTGGVSSPRSITIPSGVYIYQFVVQRPGGNEIFYLDSMDGEWTELEASGDPLHLVVNNNAQDKLASIFGLQCIFRFNSTVNVNLNSLLRGQYSDRRYYLIVHIENRNVFKGYVSLADSREAFMPHKNVVTLTATDGLGALKNKKLVDFIPANPTGKNKIIKYIAWALKQTGLLLPINVVMNIREEDADTITNEPDGQMYNTQYLDAKTFEKEIGECEDCYTVLQKILKHTCIIGQRHGEWWIKNVDEYDTHPDYVTKYDWTGDFVETYTGTYNKEIGRGYDMEWSQHRAEVSFTAPAEFARDTFKYVTPKEVPCNSNHERGDYLSDISATEKKYAIACWTLYQGRPNIPSVTSQAYYYRRFENNYEKEAFVVISAASALVEQLLASEYIPVNVGDKFDFSFSFKYNGQIETASGFVTLSLAQVRLIADDGTFWTVDAGLLSSGDRPKWYQCTSDWNTFQKFFRIQIDGTDDDTEWTSVGFTDEGCPPIPRSGYLQLVFTHGAKVDQFDLHIGSVNFQYIPLINGNYQKYDGQYHDVRTAGGETNSIDEEVYMSDSPARLFKGALHKYVSGDYTLSGRFWNAAVHFSGPPDPSYYHPFGYIQAFNVWNQCRLLNRIFTGSIQGIESGSTDTLDRSDLPGIFHTYFLRDANEHTNYKRFMLLSYDMDLRNCEFSSVTMKEVYDERAGKAYDDDHEFKYITG